MRETFQRDEAQGRASVGTVITNRPPAFGDGERGQPTTRRFGCQIRVRSTRSCGTGITTAFVVTRAGNNPPKTGEPCQWGFGSGRAQTLAEHRRSEPGRVRLPTKGQHKQHAKKGLISPPPSLVLLLPRG